MKNFMMIFTGADYAALGYVAGGVILVAFFITWISTFFATQRFLNLQTNDLYY